ncbi:MAG: CDP-glycerol glycerophosphotransferase family protein [Propionibacteriaceae bacterium]|nr:CDP-glycerol glycerophosphotransferase family protein [Propionibacteriaceae bacterium]
MKIKLASFLKRNQLIYDIYFYVFSALLAIVRLFVRTDDRLILFISFGGKKYDDSPRALFEYMKADRHFADYRFVWAFHDVDAHEVPGAKKIKVDTPGYFLTALRARAWVTNSAVERGLRFKGRHTYYVNTWHGVPLKRLGNDQPASLKSSFRRLETGKHSYDTFLIQGEFDRKVLTSAYNISPKQFLMSGLPRNDVLANAGPDQRIQARARIGVPEGKKVILYAPTFREYLLDGLDVVLPSHIDFQRWEAELGDDYVFLFRAHYEVARVTDFPAHSDFARDVSSYPELADLMIAADVLISDYSSIFFDFAILKRPMICYAYDYDEYESKRGLYFDVRKELPAAETEDGVLALVKQGNALRPQTFAFRGKFLGRYGCACETVADNIYQAIRTNSFKVLLFQTFWARLWWKIRKRF